MDRSIGWGALVTLAAAQLMADGDMSTKPAVA